MSVDAGVVRVELLGLGGGVARTAMLRKGQSLTYEDMRVKFADFDLSDFDPQAGKINFGVVCEVTRGGRTVEVVPAFHSTPGGDATTTPATIPGTDGVTLNIGRVDAEGGAVELQIIDPSLPAQGPTPQSLVLDVSTKPLISLVGVGTLLAMAGVAMAVFLRRRDLAAIKAESH